MIVVHRAYAVLPGRMAEFLAVYEALGYPLQRKHLGEPIGFFASMDIGDLNEVVHLWSYRDEADRAARREALKAEPGWQAYLDAAMPLLQRIESKTLTPAAFSPAIPADTR
jgi:hypothetical protein